MHLIIVNVFEREGRHKDTILVSQLLHITPLHFSKNPMNLQIKVTATTKLILTSNFYTPVVRCILLKPD